MKAEHQNRAGSGRRAFLRTAGALAGGAATMAFQNPCVARPLTEPEKLARIASNTWPVRALFKSRSAARRSSPETEAFKKKYGEITMLDFPQFTKDVFPGVHHMDLWSSLFGDVTDDSMFVQVGAVGGPAARAFYEFDPSSASGKKWLDKLAGKIASTGVKCHHVSNNAPRNICDLDAEKRKEGIAVAKKWLEGSAQIGAKSMRVNTGGPRVAPSASATQGYPRNDEIVKYLRNAIESFKEMADYLSLIHISEPTRPY